MFRDGTKADILLTSIGFPPSRKTIFSDNPLNFWTEICNEIEHGAIESGFEKLIQAASKMYPSNKVFSPVRHSEDSSNDSAAVSLKVFLSYASGDRAEVLRLYNSLKNDGFAPWIAEENIVPGQDRKLEITKAVRKAYAVVICLSNESVTKAGQVHREIKMALDAAQEQPEGTIFIIPLRLQQCDIPYQLTDLQGIDYFEDQERGYSLLVRGLKKRAEELSL